MFIDFDDVEIGYEGRALLERFSLSVERGEFLSIVGSNGSGKTTLLRTMLGFLKPVSGRIRMEPGLKFGYVSQKSRTNSAFPLTVEKVVMMGRIARMGLLCFPKVNDRAIVQKVLDDVGIGMLAKRDISVLSGGQYQRMLIARALASQPEVLVFDEPTRGMDLVAEHIFFDLVGELQKNFGLTIIMVLHDLTLAARASQKLVVINGTDKSLCVGKPHEVLTEVRLSALYHRPVRVVAGPDGLRIVVEHTATEMAADLGLMNTMDPKEELP